MSSCAMSPLDPRASRAWNSAYHGLRERRRADGGSAFPALWGAPWDTHFGYRDKRMYIQSLTEITVLTLPERDATVWDRMQALGLEFLG